MDTAELILIAVGLSMDAFAVSVCRGLNMKKFNPGSGLLTAFMFGLFQGIMPLIGWLLGTQFASYITSFDHWIAFALLSFLGGKMIFESIFSKGEDEACTDKDSFKQLLVMSVATSIDALAVGITFAFLQDGNILASCSLIAIITFVLSFIGVVIGNVFGARFRQRAEIAGGVILILIGLKILLEHLGIISF